MTFSIRDYIQQTIRKDATIKYDPSVKQWIGILHHEIGSLYAQQKTKMAVVKELKEILEEFLVRFFQQKHEREPSTKYRAKTHASQVSRVYHQA